MKHLILNRDDFHGGLHTGMWEYICDYLELAPCCKHGDYPESIEVVVHSAKDADS